MGKYTIETLAEINAEYLMENYKNFADRYQYGKRVC